MRSKQLKLAGAGAALVAIVAVLMANGVFGDTDAAKDEKVATDKAKPKAALTVTTVLPSSVTWPRTLTANGNIVAWQEVVIAAEIQDLRLTEVLVNVGDQVKRGQVLARIASDTLDADLAQSQAVVAEEQAKLAEAAANADRARQLKTTNLISAQQINQTLTAEKTAKARLAAAQALAHSAALRLSKTRVLAPDSGVISARGATVGSLAQPAQELFRLIRQNKLEWHAEVTAAELSSILPGQKVSVQLSGGASVEGRVRIAAPTVNPQTRIGLVYVDLPSATSARAGTFAPGVFELGEAPALVLPQSALLLRDGFTYVFKIEGSNQVAQVKVSTGRRIADDVEIVSGLEPNTPVVASGAGFLTDGDTVRVVDAQTTMLPAPAK